MPVEDQVVSQSRQTFSAEMVFQIPPQILVEQLQRQLHDTRMAINEQYKDVTMTVETVSFIIEIIHDGEKL